MSSVVTRFVVSSGKRAVTDHGMGCMKRALLVILGVYLVGVITLETSLLVSHYMDRLIHGPADFLRLALHDFVIAALWPILLVVVVLDYTGLIRPIE